MLKSKFDVPELKKQLEKVQQNLCSYRYTLIGSERELLIARTEHIVSDLLWDLVIIEGVGDNVR